MANPVVLSREWHGDIKVITDRTAEFGDGVHVAPVLATEASALVLDFPICLIKDQETGQFQLHVLLGFDQGENLYLDGNGWRSSYVPVHVRRQPFLLGFAADDGDGGNSEPMISLDMESPRVNKERGEALFGEDGSRTDFLKTVERTLADLLRGGEATEEFVSVLVEADLIEPVKLDVTFANDKTTTYEGVYTISDIKLADLKGEALEQMNANGMLQICHYVVGSLGHLGKLIAWKNERLKHPIQ